MIQRHRDVESLMKTMEPYAAELKGFYPVEWLSNSDNVCLTDGNGNFTLFERTDPTVVIGHYFLVDRGKRAFELCREFLEEIFTGPYEVDAIFGLTPLDKKGALWMNKRLGFKTIGEIETIAGPCEMVRLTKKEWADG